jgi:hypothetical protein
MFLFRFLFGDATALHKLIGYPIYEIVLFQLLTKQIIDIIVENISQYIAIESEILAKLVASKGNVVLNKLVYQLVRLCHPKSFLVKFLLVYCICSLTTRIRSIIRISLCYLAVLDHYESNLQIMVFTIFAKSSWVCAHLLVNSNAHSI